MAKGKKKETAFRPGTGLLVASSESLCYKDCQDPLTDDNIDQYSDCEGWLHKESCGLSTTAISRIPSCNWTCSICFDGIKGKKKEDVKIVTVLEKMMTALTALTDRIDRLERVSEERINEIVERKVAEKMHNMAGVFKNAFLNI